MSLNLPPVDKPKKEHSKPKPLFNKETFSEAFKKGQKIFGYPGAALTWGINGVKGISSIIGINGEEQTAKVLEQYAKENDGVYVFHSLMWPQSNGDTDHVLVYKNNIVIIDSKRWKSVRKYSISASGFVMRGTVPFPEGKVKTLYAVNKWREALPNFKISAIVCIAQEKVFVQRDRNWYRAPFRLTEIDKLKEQLDYELKNVSEEMPDNYGLLQYLSHLTVKPRNLRSEFIREDGINRQ